MHYLYKFLGQNKEEIYIGETDNVDRRMKEHRNRKDNLWNEKTEILFATVDDKTKAKQWERLLIEKHLPKYNVKTNLMLAFRLKLLNRNGNSSILYIKKMMVILLSY